MRYNFSLAKAGAISFHMTVSSQNKKYDIDLDHDNFNKIVGYCNNSGKAVTPFTATLYPVRTNNFKNFSKDCFLPTVMNHAIEVDNMAAKVFAIIGALFLDLITSPIRLLTFVPRIILNALKKEHPLHCYLRKNGHNEVLDSDSVKVCLLQKGLGWQRKEVHFRDFPAPLLYSDSIGSSGNGF